VAEGLFPLADLAARPAAFRSPRCGACGLHLNCKSPKMPVAGEGKRKILVVGEAPGRNEDEQNLPFVGRAGHRLRRTLERFGCDLFRDCWVTNALRCRPGGDNKIEDARAVDYCRPYAVRAVEELKPEVVILLGETAVRSVVGHLWRERPGPVGRWVGWKIPCRRWNCWVCPTYHPSMIDRKETAGDADLPLAENYFASHLRAALKLAGRPWRTIPDYAARVDAVVDPDDAARIIALTHDAAAGRGGAVMAFDFETTTLKPDGPGAEIVCCAVCFSGIGATAFPWHPPAVGVVRELLRDPTIKKIGANLKFEDRWCRRKLGTGVRGWAWDTILAAHALDARGGGTTSVKFQAFVRLGLEDYSAGVAPYLKAGGGGNARNRVKEVPLPQLLRYCGTDALAEYELAQAQMKEMGVDPCSNG
jgi:uracil-DNA glycosylase family 4